MEVVVYKELAESVIKKLNKMNEKAKKYNVSFSFAEVGETLVTVHVMSNGCEIGKYTAIGVRFEIECDTLIKANGWTVCAMIEHGKEYNIVTNFGSYQAGKEWYTAKPKCDHCHINRHRKTTYLVKNESGEIRQVGSSCLMDYTGISPVTAVLWAEIKVMSEDEVRCSKAEWERGIYTRIYSVRNIIALSYDAIKKYSYRKSGELYSTRDIVTKSVMFYKRPSKDGLKEADRIIDWLRRQSELLDTGRADWDKTNDIVKHCIPLVLFGYAKTNQIGWLAYLPVLYRKTKEYNAQKAWSVRSGYVGEAGDYITIKIKSINLLKSWENQWGLTYLYKIVDTDDNVFIWYAPSVCEATSGESIRAMVKGHNEWHSTKETIITKCKVLDNQ